MGLEFKPDFNNLIFLFFDCKCYNNIKYQYVLFSFIIKINKRY